MSKQLNVYPGRQLENGIYSDARVLTPLELMLLSPIYAEMEFVNKGKASEGFPAEYESVYEIVKIIKTTKLSDNSCE